MFRRQTHPATSALQLMNWAWQTAGTIDWSRWRPTPADPLVGKWFFGQPPLTRALILDYARFHGWLVGRPLAFVDFGMLERHLAQRWEVAAAQGDFVLVRDVIADVLVWTQIVAMPANRSEALRESLLARHPAYASRPATPAPVFGSSERSPRVTASPAVSGSVAQPASAQSAPEESAAAASNVSHRDDDAARKMMSGALQADFRNRIADAQLAAALAPRY
jgi:hypothetical protein